MPTPVSTISVEADSFFIFYLVLEKNEYFALNKVIIQIHFTVTKLEEVDSIFWLQRIQSLNVNMDKKGIYLKKNTNAKGVIIHVASFLDIS